MKAAIAALTDVPEAFRSEYELRDGAYHLKVDGDLAGWARADVYNTLKVADAEKRENNIKLLKALGADSLEVAIQRAGLIAGLDPAKLARLKAIDPDEYEALKTKAGKLKDKGLDDPDAVEARIKAIVEAAIGPLNTKLETSEKARTEAQKRADDALLRETIGSKFVKAGGKQSATDFIVAEFQKDFRVVDNAVKPHEGRFSAERVGQPLSDEEWLTSATKKYDFAFGQTMGGGASGGTGTGGGAGASRPGVKVMKNPTPQELGSLKFVAGKGLVNAAGETVVIEQETQAAA